MELSPGTDFFDHVRPVVQKLGSLDVRALDERRLRRALMLLVDALEAIHATGRVHCDVKPSNIRVEPEGRVVLLDFGLVTTVSGANVQSSSEMIQGTPCYMAPEQCRGETLSPAADAYAVGVVLYEALTGRLPFDGEASAVCLEKQRLLPPHPSEIEPDLPSELANLCMRLLDPNMEQRASLRALRELLSKRESLLDVPAPRDSLRPQALDTPFVGRDAELLLLTVELDQTRAGRPSFVYICGESGLGKSALGQAFARAAARDRGALVLAGRCHERETVPYKAFDGIVDALSRHLESLEVCDAEDLLPHDARLIAQLFPVLSQLRAMRAVPSAPEPQDPLVLRARAFASLREVLCRLSVERPLLLLLDDIQWSDLDSLTLWRELLVGPEAPACLVIATGRSLTAEVASALEPLLSADISRKIELGALTRDDTLLLVRSLLGREDPGLQARIASEGQGHPLFLSELARKASEGLPLDAGFGLDDVLGDRIRELESGARRTLELLAVASAPVARPTLARALDVDPSEVDRRLTKLKAAHLARSDVRDTALCYHDRVRDAVLRTLSTEDQRLRHRALATSLSSTSAVDAERIAYEWRAAGDAVRAARYCARAAVTARRALAFNRAARLYEEALFEPEAFDDATRRALRIEHARALSAAGFAGRAAEVFVQAAAEASDGEGRALRRKAAQLMLQSGRIAEGIALADRVLAEVALTRPSTPARAVVRLTWERSQLALSSLSQEPLRDHHDASTPSLDALWAVAPSLAFVDLLAGSALQSRYTRLALKSGSLVHTVRSLAIEAMLGSTTEAPPQKRVDSMLTRLREVSHGTQDPYLRAVAWMAHGYVHWVRFGLTEALGALAQAERLLRERCINVAWELTNVRAALLNTLWNMGKLQRHEELSREWLAEARQRGDRYAAIQLTVIGLAYQTSLTRGAHDAAESLLESCLEDFPQSFQLPHWGRYIGLQLSALQRGDGSALRLMRATWPKLRRSQLLRAPYLALLSHCDAAWSCIDAALGEGGRAREELLDEARGHARRVQRTGWPLAASLADQIEAQLHIVAGNPDAAAPLLLRALSVLDEHASIYAPATAYLASHVVAPESSHALRARALSWAERESLAHPERFFATFAPALRTFS